MYKYLLWDIDGTIVDFLTAEKAAIKTLFREFELGECTDEMVSRYSEINVRYWEMLERGEMTKPEILIGRFREFFQAEGLDVTVAEAFNLRYQIALGDTVAFYDHAFELLTGLKDEHYIQAAITNGTKIAQTKKLKTSKLDTIFDEVFISEDVGAEKPDPKFFDVVKENLHFTEEMKAEILVIGDSLTSDIWGGIMAGFDTCWYNPGHKINDKSYSPTYEIQKLQDILQILNASK